MSNPQLEGRTLVEIATEAIYGVDPGGTGQLALYDDPNVEIDPVVLSKHESREFAAPPFLRQGFPAIGMSNLSTFVAGSGTVDEPPTWVKLLEASGMPLYAEATDANQRVWRTALSDYLPSVTLRYYNGGRKRVMRGSRCTWQVAGEASYPVRIIFDADGLWAESTKVAVPRDNVEVGVPPSLCGSDFSITPEGEAAIVPVITSFAIGLNTVRVAKRPSSDAHLVKEHRISGFAPQWSAVIEQDSDHEWVDRQLAGQRFALTIQVGADVGDRFKFRTPTGLYVARLTEPPREVRSGGILYWSLVFGLSDQRGRHLEVVHT